MLILMLISMRAVGHRVSRIGVIGRRTHLLVIALVATCDVHVYMHYQFVT